MTEDLKAKAEVISDLLAKGAEEVTITGTDIKVVSKKSQQAAGGTTQIVNVQANASVQSSTTLSLRLNLAQLDLQKIYKNTKKLSEIDEKLNLLEKELAKAKPNKGALKKLLKWALNFGWDVFLKIAPVIIDKLLADS